MWKVLSFSQLATNVKPPPSVVLKVAAADHVTGRLRVADSVSAASVPAVSQLMSSVAYDLSSS